MKSASEHPDEVRVSSLITQHGEIKEAEEIFENMRSACELPDVVASNSLVGDGCAKQGHAKKADEVFDK